MFMNIPTVVRTSQKQTVITITVNHPSRIDVNALGEYLDKIAMYDASEVLDMEFEDWETFVVHEDLENM